jgi:small-conductance mechanosensitive channel
MVIRATTLSLISKAAGAIFVSLAIILTLCGFDINMSAIVTGAGFLSAAFISVDISKVRQSVAPAAQNSVGGE